MAYTSELAPQQLLEKAYELIAKDKARFGNVGYPVYNGPTVAPMSALTQKAREYQERFAQKGAPFSKKIQTVLNKPNEAISPAGIQGLLEQVRQSQAENNENSTLRMLRNQFNSSYTPEREASFRTTSQRNNNIGMQELSGNLSDINKAASNLEATKNQQVIAALQALGLDKQARRESLLGNLEQHGNQKHAHANKVIQANKARFMQEESEPQRKLEMLRQAIEPHSKYLEAGAEIHPDLAKSMGRDVIQALSAYGIDTSKPTEQWGNSRIPTPRYKGELVAPITPEMQASYDTLARIGPSIKDTYSDQRKDIVKGFLGNETTASKALPNIPEAMRGKVSRLEEDALQRRTKDLRALNNKYIQLGQYGSPQHIGEVERRAQEINKLTQDERNRLLSDATRNQISLQHEGDINNLKKLNNLGQEGHKEYFNLMGNIRKNTNLGSTKWQNNQDENEQLYKNFQNELNWEWPHMRNAVRGEAHDEIFGNMSRRGMALDDIARNNTSDTRFSELQREYQGLQNNYRTVQEANAGLQTQLGQQRQAEATLAAQRAQQQREQEAENERRRIQNAERNRLARIAPAPVQKDWRQPGNYYLPENILNNILSEHQGRYNSNPAFGDVLNMATQWHQSFGRKNGHAILTPDQLDKFTNGSLNNNRYGDWANQYKQYLYSPAPQNNNVPPQGDGMALRNWYIQRGLIKK